MGENLRSNTNSPIGKNEDCNDLFDDFVEIEYRTNTTNDEGTLDSISFKRAAEHGLFLNAQTLHSHIFDIGGRNRPRTVRMIVHDDSVNFSDILSLKRWIIESK